MTMKRTAALAPILVAAMSLGLGVPDAVAAKVGVAKVPINPVLKAPPTPVSPVYRFSLDSFIIKDTRSLHKDTDFVTVSITGQPNETKEMGDVNNGTHPVGLSYDLAVQPNQTVKFTYVIINSSKGANLLVQFFTGFTADLIAFTGANIDGIMPGSCDGIVAQKNLTFTGVGLAAQTAGGKKVTGQDFAAGTDSPHGCGSNSRYYVNWSVSPE
jgi:hypothetical protein